MARFGLRRKRRVIRRHWVVIRKHLIVHASRNRSPVTEVQDEVVEEGDASLNLRYTLVGYSR